MAVGVAQLSESDSAGSSTAKPPACQTPRLTSSTEVLWQGWASLQVLMIPTTGLAMKSSIA